jgi:thiol-disulfide isomerase/thioredoxin
MIPNKTEDPISVAYRIYRSLGIFAILGTIVVGALHLRLFKNSAFPHLGEAEQHFAGALGFALPTVLAAHASNRRPILSYEGSLPNLDGATAWFNSAQLNPKSLRGKVVLVNFWTYSCINSLRALPYVKYWAAKYQSSGLVVIGVHTPEFSFEKEPGNVQASLHDLNITYPVPLDADYRIWHAFDNEYWPAFYIIDAKGEILYHQFGEGNYSESEQVIRELLRQNGATNLDADPVGFSASGVEAPPNQDIDSPETYIGYHLAERFASPGRLAHDSPKSYSPPAKPRLNQWALSGTWIDGAESAVLQLSIGTIVFRFHSRDLHMVLGPTKDGKPVRFRVKLDGVTPGVNCGSDSAPDGTGVVREYRLYQLIRQKDQIADRTFEIEFLDPGVQAFSFTFG